MTPDKVEIPEQNAETMKLNKEIPKDDKQEEGNDKYSSIFLSVLITLTVVGSFKIYNIIEDFRKPIYESDPSYNFPSYSQLFQVVFWIPLMAVRLIIKFTSYLNWF